MLPKIYHPNPLSLQDEIILTPQASVHCAKVLRIKIGEKIALFCGDNQYYFATVVALNPFVRVKIFDKAACLTESPLRIHLGQGLLRQDKFDWVLQKAVECGVTEITPLLTKRSIIQLKKDRLQHKMQHWNQIIISACEQSGRAFVPLLHSPQFVEQWVDSAFEGSSIVLDPNAHKSIKNIQPQNLNWRILIGPESGLEPTELALAQKNHFLLCHLGPRILRAETAPIVVLSLLQICFGDF